MSLAASMSKFRSDISEAASRNLAHSRPSSTAQSQTSTKAPGIKRPHDAIISPSSQPAASAPRGTASGSEIMTHVVYAVQHLKEKYPNTATFDDILAYLSLPHDLQKHNTIVKRALQGHDRVLYTPKSASTTGKETFRHRPIHPVTNADELRAYLVSRPTSAGVSVKELKDGWPECIGVLDKLEREHAVLVTRNKKDNTPRMVWADNPSFHARQDGEFVDFWGKTKLPASEIEISNELEKAGLTPTSQVKELKKAEPKRREKRRINRAGGKTTNMHMMGILKDYSRSGR